MKYLFLLIMALFMTSQTFAQVEIPKAIESTETIQMYENTNGIQNITPSQIFEKQGNTTKVYNTNLGVKNITPSKIIIRNGNNVSEYTTNEGIRSITPSKTYIIQDN